MFSRHFPLCKLIVPIHLTHLPSYVFAHCMSTVVSKTARALNPCKSVCGSSRKADAYSKQRYMSDGNKIVVWFSVDDESRVGLWLFRVDLRTRDAHCYGTFSGSNDQVIKSATTKRYLGGEYIAGTGVWDLVYRRLAYCDWENRKQKGCVCKFRKYFDEKMLLAIFCNCVWVGEVECAREICARPKNVDHFIGTMSALSCKIFLFTIMYL